MILTNTDTFDCTNETGAIGDWSYGTKIFITNSYFRNMFEPVSGGVQESSNATIRLTP
jgi:hypothetical protein